MLEALEHECWQGRHNDPVQDLLRVAKTLSELEPLAAVLEEVLK